MGVVMSFKFGVSSVLSAIAVCSLLSSPANSAGTENPYDNGYLSGDWNGRRIELLNSGIDTEIVSTMDLVRVMSGLKTGNSFIANIDARMGFDGAKVYGIEGNTSNIHIISVTGASPNATRLGSVEGISSIEANINGFKIYEAWTEQRFGKGDQMSLLIGLRDLNNDFLTMEMTDNFMKPTMQLMPTIANSGRAGASGYPNTSLAARLKYEPSSMAYLQVAAFDGVPGNPNHPRGTHISLGAGDGSMLIAEAGFTPRVKGQEDRTPNKLAVGYWRYSAQRPDLAVPARREINQGVYLLSSYEFFGDNQGRTVGAFFKTGLADKHTHQVDWDYQVGLVANGLIPSRINSEIGIGFTNAENSDDYKAANPTADNRESSFNAYYRDELIPGVMVQPEYQYIVNPGSVVTTKTTSVAGVRVEMNF